VVTAAKRKSKEGKPVRGLREVSSKRSLKNCVHEPVVGAYFSTVFRVVDERTVYWTFSSRYAADDYPTLDPNYILAKARELDRERGMTKKVAGHTVLVAKGRSHSLLIGISGLVDEVGLDLRGRTLTIGSLYSKIRDIVEDNSLESAIYVTREHPKPISACDLREWRLVNGRFESGWNLVEDAGSSESYLGATPLELLLHAYINAPLRHWRFS